ncbi:ATP-binding cassette domain-containing protein [Herbaspirillum sp. HC18]|nr:ATP-binding cassette domain-containing protein [Herbaspirillum sp. HC18]
MTVIDIPRNRAELPIIRIERASKSFATPKGDFHAVSDVSLSIQRGDVFGIIGTSGAGKSTLLRLINLLERPDKGNIFVSGHEITSLPKADLRTLRRSIGMIFQQFNLLQNATVADNVAFPLRIHGAPRADIDVRVHECLDIVGLKDKADVYPSQLSGGQKQRVAIARALATNPSILLCDEPTSALDPQTTRSVLEVLKDINMRFGVTIVIVTHELPVVRALCRNVAVMEHGRIVEQFAADALHSELRTDIARELSYA